MTPGVDAAERFLLGYLAEGPRRAADIRRAAKLAGVKFGVLYTARSRMGIVIEAGCWSLA